MELKNIHKKAIIATQHLLNGPFTGGIHYFHQYFRLRKYETTFITQPLSPRLFFTEIGSFYRKLWRIKSSKNHIVHFTPIHPQRIFGPIRKYIFEYYLKLPCFKIDEKLKKFGLINPDILFCEASLALSIKSFIKPKRYVIRFSDSMIDLGYEKDMVDLFVDQARMSDLILVAAAGIKDELISFKVQTDKIVILPNGVDTSRYEKDYEKPDAYKKLTGPIAVYVGNIGIIDHDLLRLAASHLPSVNFFIIGPHKKNVMKQIPHNLVYHGYVLPDKVPSYIQNATVGLVPIIAQRWGIMERPRKLYEYLAAGIPVVSTRGKYALPTTYVQYADTPQQFIDMVGNVVNTNVDKEAIKKYAKTNFSWDKVYEKLDELL